MRELSFTRMSMPCGHCPWEGVVVVLVEVVLLLLVVVVGGL